MAEEIPQQRATFNPAALEVQDFYEDVKRIKALFRMAVLGDYSQLKTAMALLNTTSWHFDFKLTQTAQDRLKNALTEAEKEVAMLERLNTPVQQKKALDAVNAVAKLFFLYKSGVGLSIRFEDPPMSDLERLDQALGIQDVPLWQFLNVDGLGDRIKVALKNEWDAVVAITGNEGTGKSVLGCWLGGRIDNNFDFAKNIAFVPDESQIFDMITQLPKGACVDLDEAINAFYKLNWQSRMQVMLNKLFTLCRDQGKAVLLCIPNLLDLNKFMRGRRVVVWIHVIKRGLAAVFIRDTNPFIQDTWNFDVITKTIIKEKVNFTSMKSDAQIRFLKRLPNYAGTIHFPPLPERFNKQYQELKGQNRYEELEADIKKTGDQKETKLTNALYKTLGHYRKAGKTWVEIGELMDISKEYARELGRKAGLVGEPATIKEGEI